MLPPKIETRPWHRLRYWLLAGFVLVVITIGWAVVETRKVQHARPNVSVDYRAEFRDYAKQYVEFGPEDGAAAWRLMVELLEAAANEAAVFQQELESDEDFKPRFEFDEPAPDFTYVLHGAALPSDAHREHMAIDRMRQRGVMEQLAQFVDRAPGYNPQPTSDILFEELWPHLQQARRVTQMRVASMRFAQADGDFAEVSRAFEQTLALGRTIALQPAIISTLVGIAIQAIATNELTHQLRESEFDVKTLRDLIRAMQAHQLPTATYAISGERAITNDALQHMFTDNGRGGGYLIADLDFSFTPRDDRSFAKAFVSRFVLADRRETQRAFDEVYDAMILEANKLPAERWQTFDLDGILDALSWRHQLVKNLVPAVERAASHVDFSRTMRDGTLLMAALALHRALHGAYPPSLDTLVPDILPELPVDPLHGGPYGYRLVDGDEHGRPYVLYTFGLDGVDNGGHEPSGENPRLAMTSTDDGQGYDYVFNRPRDEWDLD